MNGSNARIYYIGFDDSRVFHQIATDGGFLETPLQTNRVILAPGERAEILVDFSDGAEVVLKSYPEAGLLETIESFFGGIGTGNLQLLKIVPQPANRASHALPERLNTISRIDASHAAKTRPMVLGGPTPGGRGGPGGPLGPPINGKILDMERMDEVVRLGDIEIWEVDNRGGQAHPFHVHLVSFKFSIATANRPPVPNSVGKTQSWCLPGCRSDHHALRAICRSSEVPYMYHCHIMEHEDNGMMGQFLVVEEPEQLGNRTKNLPGRL